MPYHPDVVISFDSEFERKDPEREKDGRTTYKTNHLLIITATITWDGGFIQRYVEMPPYRFRDTRKGRFALNTYITRLLKMAEDAGWEAPKACLENTLGKRGGVKKRRSLRVCLVAHFTRADLPAFVDWNRIKKWDSVRGTYATVMAPKKLRWQRYPNKKLFMSVRVVDTLLLAPAGFRSLEQLGSALGVEKLDPGTVVDEEGNEAPAIERMSLLRDQDRERFISYAMRDTEVPLGYLALLDKFLTRHFNESAYQVPTLSSVGVRYLKKNYPDLLDNATGFTRHPDTNKRVRVPQYAEHLSLLAQSFHGGMNLSFYYGYSSGRKLYDIDLIGCYPTVLGSVREIDWEGVRVGGELSLSDVATLEGISVCSVSFEFPESVRFPCLPVRTDRGLVFPRKGDSYCTGPEVVVALNLGAAVELNNAILIPYVECSDDRVFLELAKVTTAIRGEYPKGSLENAAAKEIGNSLYGKTAQAVSVNRSSFVDEDTFASSVFDTKTGKYEPMAESYITAAHVATATTGWPRALLAELLNALPEDAEVMSVTTDGFLSSVSLEEIDTTGPVARQWIAMRARAEERDDPEILETKHVTGRVFQMKTRGTLTASMPVDTSPVQKDKALPVLARAGVKTPAELLDEKGSFVESRHWIEVNANRTRQTKYGYNRLIDIAGQWHKESDLMGQWEERRLSWDADFKCRPYEIGTKQGLLTFTTKPWETARDFLWLRNGLDRWRDVTNRVLRTMRDWEDFADYLRDRRSKRVKDEELMRLTSARHILGGLLKAGATRAEILAMDLPGVTADMVARADTEAPCLGVRPTQSAAKYVVRLLAILEQKGYPVEEKCNGFADSNRGRVKLDLTFCVDGNVTNMAVDKSEKPSNTNASSNVTVSQTFPRELHPYLGRSEVKKQKCPVCRKRSKGKYCSKACWQKDHDHRRRATDLSPRACVQCGEKFTPKRTHARYCCSNCRVAFKRKKGD